MQEEELRRLLEKKPNPVAYDGFEPSGRMHIAQASDAARSVGHAVVCWRVCKIQTLEVHTGCSLGHGRLTVMLLKACSRR